MGRVLGGSHCGLKRLARDSKGSDTKSLSVIENRLRSWSYYLQIGLRCAVEQNVYYPDSIGLLESLGRRVEVQRNRQTSVGRSSVF
jgi:hypothetical protein